MATREGLQGGVHRGKRRRQRDGGGGGDAVPGARSAPDGCDWLWPGAVVSSGRVFDRSGPLYYDYMKNYDIPATCYFTLFSLSRTLTVRDK